jgi:alpha-tubulin suppressor-like RCC1 family protein
MLAATTRVAARSTAVAVRRASTSSSVCLTWGEGTHGELGHYPFVTSGLMKQYLELTPRQLEGVDFRDIACGTNHTLAVDDNGKVWSWGKGENGKLGHGDDADRHKPEMLQGFAGVDIVKVACGESHSLALDKDGRCYAWGWGGSWVSGGGHLGQGSRDHVFEPTLIEGALEEAPVTSISAGEAHSVFLTSDGEVWTCGAGEHGRNGNGGSSDVLKPEPVTALDDVEIVEAQAGSAFTVTRCSEGLVRVWGRNDQGQLGLGGGLAMDVYALEDLPIIVERDDVPLQASAVAAGHSHVAVVSTDSELLQWGAKLALGPAPHLFEEEGGRVPLPSRVWCGGGYTLVESTDGVLYSFGQGGSKCLGHGDKAREPHPKKVEALSGFSAATVACGFRHAAALGSWSKYSF